GSGKLRGIELDVIADEEIEASIAIVVKPGAARAPANLFVVDTGLAGYICEGSISIVMEEDVVSPEATEEIIPAVVVVVADADASLPSGTGEAGFCGDVGEGPVAIVFEQVGRRCGSGRPVRIEARAVREIDVEPTVIVVVKECEAASLGLDDVAFAINAAPHVGNIQ